MTKTGKFKYDVFISYRRDGGAQFAQTLKEKLTKCGATCFLDLETLKTGHFDEKLLEAIDASRVVLPVLTNGALDRCRNKDDWVRKEIAYAIQREKTLVPILSNPDISRQFVDLPTDIADLPKNQWAVIDPQHDLQNAVEGFVERYLGWIADREKDFLGEVRKIWSNRGTIDAKNRIVLRDLAAKLGIPEDRCYVIMGEEESKLVELGRHSKKSPGIFLLVVAAVAAAAVVMWLHEWGADVGLTRESSSTSSSLVCAEISSNPMLGNGVEKSKCVDVGAMSRPDKLSFEKVLAALPSVRHSCKLSLVSPKGLMVRNARPVKNGVDSGENRCFDYLLKIEIDRDLYDAKIAPALCAAFADVTITPQSVVRMRNGVGLCGDRGLTQEKIFDAYVSQDEKIHSSLSAEGSDAIGDEAARLSSTVLGDFRGLSCSARIGDGGKENMKAVVLTDISIPLTQAKGKMYELTPDVLDKIDAWRDRQESGLEFDVVLLDGKGGELAVSSVKLCSYQLSYCNYMDYFGKEHRALLVAPFVGGSSLACYKWVRFEMSSEDAGRVASMKVE